MNRFLGERQFYFPLCYWLSFLGIFYSSALTIFLFAFHRHQDETWYNFLLAVGMLSTFAIGTFALFYVAITQRANHLIRMVNRFAQGDLATRVTLSGRDEFVALGAAFNQMVEQWAAQRQKHEQTEAALQANQELMQGLLARLDVVVWSAPYDGTSYHYISPSIEQVYGYPITAFQANLNLWQEIIHPADGSLVQEAYQSLVTTGAKQIEYRIMRPDGTIRWLLQRSILVCDAAGHPRRFDGMAADITTYKQTRLLLAERARLDALRAEIGAFLLQSNGLPVILQQCADAIVTHLDAAFVRIWTFNPESQWLELQASAGLYMHLDGSHSRIALGQFVIGQIAQQRLPYITTDLLSLPQISERSWAQREGITAFAGYPLIVEGDVVGVIAAFARQPFSPAVLDNLALTAGGLAQFIERKQTEGALRTSEERFRLAIEGARHGVWDWNVVTGEIVVNQPWATVLGYELSDLTAHIGFWNQLIHPEDQPIIARTFADHEQGRAAFYECEHRVRTKNGEWKWVFDRAQIVSRDLYDQPLRVTGILEDITARKQAELVLQNFFRLSLDLLCIASTDGYFKYVNPAFEQTLGFSVAELLGKPFIAFIYPQDIASTQAKVQLLAAGQGVIDFENRYRCKDGSYRWLSWRAAATKDGDLMYAVARDVTAQKRQNQLMAQTHAAAQVGGWELDFTTNKLYWTNETYRIHDTTPACYQPTVENAIDFYAPSSVRDITEQKQAEEGRFIRKIAEAVPHAMYVYDLDDERYVYINHQVQQNFGYSPEEIIQMGATFFVNHLHENDRVRLRELDEHWHRAVDGEVLEIEYQLRHKSGEWRWFAGRVAIFLRDPGGHVRQIIGTAHDVTEYKRAQQQILAALKEKEVLLKEMHHRVKNNLQIISSLLNLQMAHIKDSSVFHIFTETKNRVRAMALLHETLYRTETLARIDFQRYVDTLCAHLFRSYGVDPQRIELQTVIAGVTLGLDQAIPCGLLINELISNAIKYAFPHEQRGTIWVTLHPHAGHQYELCVRDNGVGLPVDLDLTRTESLGLRLVHDLTLQLNGELTISHTTGATFTILFEQ